MPQLSASALFLALTLMSLAPANAASSTVQIASPSCEYLANPQGIDTTAPRLAWKLQSSRRGAAQSAYQILVASSADLLARDSGDLWDSGKVSSSETNQIAYAGKPLTSRTACFWKVRIWDEAGQPSSWSEPARWSMGLISPSDWTAQWISYRDDAPLHTSRKDLYLPAARHYRRDFTAAKPIRRATAFASALGIYTLHMNGQRVGDAYLEPGWADYHKRAYYRSYDVTSLMQSGANAIGAVVAEGWYSGYVGFGLLVGQGPNQSGRYFYGKTPALLVQLEIEYTDGTRESVVTDPSWQVTDAGPTREADIIMGESYDARAELTGWDKPGYQPQASAPSPITNNPSPRGPVWTAALPASANTAQKAVFTDALGNREVDLGFKAPPIMQAYSAPAIRATQELPAKKITEPKPGVFIFDLGQNFAGIVRLKTKGPAGTKIRIRHGEMLHKDGRLMTENLRKARATDFYTLKGDPTGETWSPSFTYHGFQYVELTGLAEKPTLETVTGLVLHNDTPLVGSFECSDEVLTQFGKNAQWTQRANFVEMPTDCPQRDERLGWMGDAQAYIRTATFNADTAAFYTKWLDDVVEAQREFGAYPDYAPYPMAHGARKGKTFGTGWTDAGIICPWTVWQVYGDTRLLAKNWASMTRFMNWRQASLSPDGIGSSIGNPWGDWLNVNEPTSIEFIDTCYYALDCTLMSEMATVLGRSVEANEYRDRRATVQTAFAKAFLNADGTLKIDSQSAYVLALWVGLIPEKQIPAAAAALAAKIEKNGNRMTTGFLGTRSLLPALTANGHHDLAVRLFQNRVFPSWGYEVVNGATSVWERWDSYTTEHGFDGMKGDQNAAMNSFSHYSFGAVMEWAYRNLAGIDTDGPGYRKISIRPQPPTKGSNPDVEPVNWVRASYDSINGPIISDWKRDGDRFLLNVTIPANTTATVLIPTTNASSITESGKPLAEAAGVTMVKPGSNEILITAGSYSFTAELK